MLSGIFLEDFQSLKKPTWINFEKLTFLYGPNSAGKSAILDAMNVLKERLPVSRKYGANDYRNPTLEYGTAFSGHVGIRFLVEPGINRYKDVSYDGFDPIYAWEQSPSSSGDRIHSNMLGFLGGKSISLILSEHSLRIDVDDCNFLRISTTDLFTEEEDRLYFDTDDNLSESIQSIFDDSVGWSVTSTIELNGHSPLFNNSGWDPFLSTHDVDYCSRKVISSADTKTAKMTSSDALFSAQLVKREQETTTIRGLRYDITTNWFGAEPIENAKSYCGDQKTPKLNALQNALTNFGFDLALFIEIVRILAAQALNNSHVRGDRQVIQSRNLYSGKVGLAGEYRSEYSDPYGQYCQALNETTSKNEFALGFGSPFPYMKFDFVAHCMSKLLASLKGYQIVPQHGSFGEYRLAIRNRSGKVLDFSEVGSGISYVFPILASLWAKKLSFIEQPELHLHPAAQCELGDVLISAAHHGSMAIIESHSEHMLLRILRRIKETTNQWLLPPDLPFSANDILIYYFKPDETGSTTVKEIRVDKYGEFTSRWPDGFFSERERELFPEYYASKEP